MNTKAHPINGPQDDSLKIEGMLSQMLYPRCQLTAIFSFPQQRHK
jgi:hypothetical protein